MINSKTLDDEHQNSSTINNKPRHTTTPPHHHACSTREPRSEPETQVDVKTTDLKCKEVVASVVAEFHISGNEDRQFSHVMYPFLVSEVHIYLFFLQNSVTRCVPH